MFEKLCQDLHTSEKWKISSPADRLYGWYQGEVATPAELSPADRLYGWYQGEVATPAELQMY